MPPDTRHDISALLAARSAHAGGFLHAFTWLKTRIYPFRAVCRILPRSGTILDYGCGRGLLACALALDADSRKIIAVDPEALCVPAARALCAGLNVSVPDFAEPSWRLGRFDCIFISDVIYLMDDTALAAFLETARSLLAPGGLLIIKEMDTRPWWKFAICYLQEFAAVRWLGLTRGDRFYFRGRAGLTALIGQLGWSVSSERLDAGYAYPHIVYHCRRVGQAAA